MSEKKDFSSLKNLMTRSASDGSIPTSQICILLQSKVIFSEAFGYLDPETHKKPADTETLFDLSTLTQLFTASLFMVLAEQKTIRKNDFLCKFLPEFSGVRPVEVYEDRSSPSRLIDVSDGYEGTVDAELTTFRQLLSHTSGLPAWHPFYQLKNAAEARKAVLQTGFSYEPGMEVVPSDIGYLLLGWALEAATGETLAKNFQKVLFDPLGIKSIAFRPDQSLNKKNIELSACNIARTEISQARGRLLIGETCDENCAILGGICGHDGLFGTAREVAEFGDSFLNGQNFLKPDSIASMRDLQGTSRNGITNFGLGFRLWSEDSAAAFAPLSPKTFGLDGFTGTSLWMDPRRDLTIALLTNEIYNGRKRRNIKQFRSAVVQAILEDLKL